MGTGGPTADRTIASLLPGSLPGRDDAPVPSLPLGQGAGGRSGCESSLLAGPSGSGITPGRITGEASGLSALPDPDPRELTGSPHGSSRSTPSSSPGVGLHHPPVYLGGMAFPSTRPLGRPTPDKPDNSTPCLPGLHCCRLQVMTAILTDLTARTPAHRGQAKNTPNHV